MLLILSENWTLAAGRDLSALVRWAREAEDAGFDAVMISEHVVLGPDAGQRGIMGNPRAYAMPGNQDPATPWPSSLHLLSAIAAVTSRVRLVAAAVLAYPRPALAADAGVVPRGVLLLRRRLLRAEGLPAVRPRAVVRRPAAARPAAAQAGRLRQRLPSAGRPSAGRPGPARRRAARRGPDDVRA
jgi:hypothetical protein